MYPSARNMAATVEESTPPDMATAMVQGKGISFLANFAGFFSATFAVKELLFRQHASYRRRALANGLRANGYLLIVQG